MHLHDQTNKMVKTILSRIATENKKTYTKIKKLFLKENIELTIHFWTLLRETYPDHPFVDVYHCPQCGKFQLE